MLAAVTSGQAQFPALVSKLSGWLADHGHAPRLARQDDANLIGSPFRTSRTATTVFDGWIDNDAELSAQLGLVSASPAELYEAVLARWGDDADHRVLGHYAAITLGEDGSFRLARSPLTAPPLLYARHQQAWVAASLPSAFKAIGMSLALYWDSLGDLLAMDMGECPPKAAFEGLSRVPLGTVVTLRGENPEVDRWYRRRPLPGLPLASDEEHIERVGQLLAEACEAALRVADRPALALSGGLDSPIVADELLRHMPASERLRSVTFVPLEDGASADMPGAIATEWPVVERFAAMHPRLEAHRADIEHGGFDHRFREVTALAGCFNPGLAHHGAHHGVWAKARELGCDWVFAADLGNQSFSADGRWAYAEDFRRLRWRTMLRNLAGRANDPRQMWKRVLALGLLPNLPRLLRHALRGLLRPERRDTLRWSTLLSANARRLYRERAAQRNSAPAWEGFAFPTSRAEAAERDLTEQDHELSEITLALELRYGLRYRDVTAYRPLVEYCMALPTRMFIRDGEHRYLARRLAEGRMPDEQRLERRYGRHGADWHARLEPRRAELLDYVARIEGHPELAKLLDTQRMRTMLEDFPEGDSGDEFANLPYALGLSRALLAAQFVGVTEGRNDL